MSTAEQHVDVDVSIRIFVVIDLLETARHGLSDRCSPSVNGRAPPIHLPSPPPTLNISAELKTRDLGFSCANHTVRVVSALRLRADVP